MSDIGTIISQVDAKCRAMGISRPVTLFDKGGVSIGFEFPGDDRVYLATIARENYAKANADEIIARVRRGASVLSTIDAAKNN